MDYTGTPLQSDYERLKRQREIQAAMLQQSMAPYQNQVVSGRVVDDRLGTGLSKIGNALMYRSASKKSDAEEAALADKYSTNQASSVQKVMEAINGRGSVGPQGPQQPIKGDPLSAAMMLGTDPYLKNNDLAEALIKAEAAKSKGRDSYYTMTPGRDNATVFNARTGQMEVQPYPGQFTPIAYDQAANYGKQYGAKSGEGAAAMRPDTGVGPQAAYKEAGEQGRVPIQQATPLTPEAQVEANALAKRDAEKIIDKPKIETKLSSAGAKTQLLGDLVSKAKDDAGVFTTGFLGAVTKPIPGTPAYNLANTLDTIKANIGFDKLREMRESSPTGGALGQVSEFENRLLQSVWGALEQSQSKEQFVENLDRVEKQVQESWKRINEAYAKDYGVPYGETPSGPPAGVDSELWDVMTPEERAAFQ